MTVALVKGQVLSAAEWNALFNSYGTLASPTFTGIVTTDRLNFTTPMVFTGTAFTNSQIHMETTWTGSNSGTDRTPFNTLYAYDRVNAGFGSGAGSKVLFIGHNIDSAAKKGAATALEVQIGLTAQSGNSGLGYQNTTYNAAVFRAIGAVNDGGTLAVPQSDLFGANAVAQISAGAGYWLGMCGFEIDVSLGTGSYAYDKIGFQVVLDTGNIESGARDDVAISVNNVHNQSATQGWNYGIMFGRLGGAFGVKTTGTLIGAGAGTGTQLASYGIDWRTVTFGTAAIWTPGFKVTGTGVTTAAGLFVQTAAANFLQLAPAATTAAPGLYAQGSDTNVSLTLAAQGTTGSLKLFTNGGATQAFQVSQVASANGFMIALAGNSAASPMQLFGSGTGNNILVGGPLGGGAQAAGNTSGYFMIPYTAGPPTGVPVNATGGMAMHYDSTNNKIYVYNGAWKQTAALT